MSQYNIGENDPRKLGEYYFRHVSAMTTEGLHSKSDIAMELGKRDKQIIATGEYYAKALLDQRQEIIDEVSVYLMDVHHGLTMEDASLIDNLLSAVDKK